MCPKLSKFTSFTRVDVCRAMVATDAHVRTSEVNEPGSHDVGALVGAAVGSGDGRGDGAGVGQACRDDRRREGQRVGEVMIG